eukprot:6063374-Prymnesium_polylepis.1
MARPREFVSWPVRERVKGKSSKIASRLRRETRILEDAVSSSSRGAPQDFAHVGVRVSSGKRKRPEPYPHTPWDNVRRRAEPYPHTLRFLNGFTGGVSGVKLDRNGIPSYPKTASRLRRDSCVPAATPSHLA